MFAARPSATATCSTNISASEWLLLSQNKYIIIFQRIHDIFSTVEIYHIKDRVAGGSRSVNQSTHIKSNGNPIELGKKIKDTTDESDADEGHVEVVLGEGEHGDPDVGEDEVLGHEVQQLKQ